MLKNYEAIHEQMTYYSLNILRYTCKDRAYPRTETLY